MVPVRLDISLNERQHQLQLVSNLKLVLGLTS